MISPLKEKYSYVNDQLINTERRTYVSLRLMRLEHLDHLGWTKSRQDYAEHQGLKPSLITSHTGIEQYVFWGYNGDLPVAVISPQPPASETQALITAIDQHVFTGSDGDTTDVQFLKTQFSGYLSNPAYEVQLFTHKPLVGLTSATDTNGYTTYYQYDTHGRLHTVLDDDRDAVKSYRYFQKSN